jgi:AraC family transcriptional regulator
MRDQSPTEHCLAHLSDQGQPFDHGAAELDITLLLGTDVVAVRDVLCVGRCRHESSEEAADTTRLVFPYRGIYIRHVGRAESVAEPNHVIFFNNGEPYRISHPVVGGDSCLSIGVAAETLLELAPTECLQTSDWAVFTQPRLPIDTKTQALAALLRHRLHSGLCGQLEAETLTLELLQRTLGRRDRHTRNSNTVRQKLVDRAKLLVASDLSRRWSLAEIATEIGISPVYLTHVFQKVEGIPLYRYQLQLRLAQALGLLSDYHNFSDLAFALGFSSHSHFSAAFKQAYGQTPSAFRRAAQI